MTRRSTPLTEHEIETFARDGVVLIQNAVEPRWVDRANAIIARIADAPGAWASDTGEQGEDRGRAVNDRYLWRTHDDVRHFVFESGIANLVGAALQCNTLRFYFDHWFVKEPGTMTGTPWHQDAPYWPFEGKQIASCWVSLSEVDRDASPLELVKGSHRWNKRFKATEFGARDPKDAWIGGDGDELPDIEADRAAYDIFSKPMHPGDALIFSAWMVHAAPANRAPHRRSAVSTRWLGDDVRWQPTAASDPTVRENDVRVRPGELAHDDDVFPVAWRSETTAL